MSVKVVDAAAGAPLGSQPARPASGGGTPALVVVCTMAAAVASVTPPFGASGLAGKTRVVASAAEPSFPTVSHKPSPAGARFIEHLRSLRQGDQAEQSKTWEQLEEVLTEDHSL
jgi:hypothetical protein